MTISLDNIDPTPDRPINFGYKMSWLAIKASDAETVLESLPVHNVQLANWRTGSIAAYSGHTFVSPMVNNWVFVVSQRLPELGGERDTDDWTSLLSSLSCEHEEVQYFGTHRVVEFHAWARFTNGTETRAFAYLGERGEILVDRGRRSAGEAELGYNYFDPDSADAKPDSYWERDDLCYPDEEHVMEIAGKWSINPNLLENRGLSQGVGWVGDLVRASDASK
ncbi:hypothetical protein [Novipirellula sp.]|uniref:hypothetical protein n=1 Tax=Novipirellula sp. TaxID=2795430 RepID=UPI0035648EB0